jgi:hypothetical protein
MAECFASEYSNERRAGTETATIRVNLAPEFHAFVLPGRDAPAHQSPV